jgi:hypothetical protein
MRQALNMQINVTIITGTSTPGNVLSTLTDVTALTNSSAKSQSILASIDQLRHAITSRQPLNKRIIAWQKLILAISSSNYQQKRNSIQFTEVQKQLKDLLETLMSSKGIKVTTLSSLKEFLKKFPKIESIYVLELYIQALTAPQIDNEVHLTAEEYHNLKKGDCTDVSSYCQDILSSIGIEARIIELNFDQRGPHIGSHDLVYFSFFDDGSNYAGFIDNDSVYAAKHGLPVKQAIYDIFQDVERFRFVDPALRKIYRVEKSDPAWTYRMNLYGPNIYNNMTNPFYIYIRIAKREQAVKVIGDIIPFDLIFDNPNDNILYFRDDAISIITQRNYIEKDNGRILRYFLDSDNRIK